MSDKFRDKVKGIAEKQSEKDLKKMLRLYKGLTLTFPNKSHHWCTLGLIFFKLANNRAGWDALTNAKKLGSAMAMEYLGRILDACQRNLKNTNVENARKMFLGEVV